jgi:DNA-binding GntR family transcriptional regulator
MASSGSCHQKKALKWIFCILHAKMSFVQAITPISRRPLHEEAIDRLRDLIVHGELAPGARLNERVLCEKLAISRTPLREAIKLLAMEGLWSPR